jgi:hypothetical protein
MPDHEDYNRKVTVIVAGGEWEGVLILHNRFIIMPLPKLVVVCGENLRVW